MENEAEVQDDGIEEPTEQFDDDGNDITDWKAIALKNQGIAKRFQTKLQKMKQTEPQTETKTETKTSDVDFGQLAFHNSKKESVKIEEDADIDFLKQTMEETGMSQKELLSKKWFQSEVKERQESRIVKEAIPVNSKRLQPTGKDSVDYWLSKGELPPADQVQLRRDVLNARIKKETDGSKFSDNSVVIA